MSRHGARGRLAPTDILGPVLPLQNGRVRHVTHVTDSATRGHHDHSVNTISRKRTVSATPFVYVYIRAPHPKTQIEKK